MLIWINRIFLSTSFQWNLLEFCTASLIASHRLEGIVLISSEKIYYERGWMQDVLQRIITKGIYLSKLY